MTDPSSNEKRRAFAYVVRIRNRNKADYAMRYLNYLMGATGKPERGELSVMGAQAVEMELARILASRA